MNAAAIAPFSKFVQSLEKRITTIRAKRTLVKMSTGIAASIALLLGVFTVEATLDSLVDLPWIARALTFACNLAASFYLLWRDSIQPFRKRLSDDAIALMVEHALPAFRTRFIASIQLARKTGRETPHDLVNALLAETVIIASNLNFGEVIKTKRMKRALLAGVGVVTLAALLIHFGNEASLLLIKRALLFNTPLPHKTTILTVTGDQKIGVGEDFKLEVTARGVLPESGQIIAILATGQTRQFTLVRDEKHPGAFSALIHSPQESFTYRVNLNDDTSKIYHVTTMQRPAVAAVSCEEIYPAYVNLPPEKKSVGDLTLLAGSKLTIVAKASVPVCEASIRLAGLGTQVPMRIDPKDNTSLVGEIKIPPKDLTGFSIHLESCEGVESGETALFRIDVVPDMPPTVAITYPARREELATEKATMLIAFDAKDDFGVAKVELHYQIDQGPEKIVPFDLGGRTQKHFTRHFDWDLGKLPTPPALGNVIEFWISVTDNNNVTEPGVGNSEHYQTKIVTADEMRLDLANRSQDALSGMKDVSTQEEELNKILGEGIFAKPKENP